MSKKFLDKEGLSVVWSKVKAQDTTNLEAAKAYTDEKIGEIPAAIVYKGDGTTITQSGDGTVTFSVGTIDQSKVNGLTAALAGKAASVHTHTSADITDLQGKLDAKANAEHTHAIADLTDLNDGWDALLKADPDVATDTDLTDLEGRVGTVESTLANKADKSVALKEITGEAAADASKVTITLTKTPVAGGSTTSPVEIPAAAAGSAGVITENRVKALAGEVAGSVYKVKGTKATIDEVLEVGTAAVGDVYNVTAEFTLNSQKFPAGTNVVFVGTEEGEPDPTQQTQWDALGGTVDLTPYETTAHATATYATKETVTALQGQVANKAEQSEVTTLSGKVDANTAAINNKLDTSTFNTHAADKKLHLPTITGADNGKVLGVVDSTGTVGWATMTIPLAEGTTTAGIVKAADDSVTIESGTIKVEALSTNEINEICV